MDESTRRIPPISYRLLVLFIFLSFSTLLLRLLDSDVNNYQASPSPPFYFNRSLFFLSLAVWRSRNGSGYLPLTAEAHIADWQKRAGKDAKESTTDMTLSLWGWKRWVCLFSAIRRTSFLGNREHYITAPYRYGFLLLGIWNGTEG